MRPPTAFAPVLRPADPDVTDRARLRWRSLSWALLAAAVAGGLSLLGAATPWAGPTAGLESALRAAGCGFFYGLLAFHLQRVDPDDGHLQAGLVGAVCGIRSLGAPLTLPASSPLETPLSWLEAALLALGQQWLPLWLPLVGAAFALPLAVRRWPALRP
ncbi:hypothetical protein NZK32_14650 [Cyanobium sp. FGCU-52]|nr:hypothetical protein [Cyanobium sp. FGCU52]